MKKFSDDQASQLAALIAYYGFFSLFPLLLVFVTVLGFVLEGNPSAQESVLHSTLSQFPIIGNQLQNNIHSLKGSGIALAIGLVGSLLAGLVHTTQAQTDLCHLYLGGQMTVLAAEINVVKARTLWPRGFYGDPLLDADKRALIASAEAEERIDEQNEEVSFDAPE